MIWRLRSHFLVSHVLPWLVIVPLMGIALLYSVRTQVLLAHQANEMATQAGLVAELAARQPAIWDNSQQAQAFVDAIYPRLTTPLLLLNPEGRLLAASNPTARSQVGQMMVLPIAKSKGHTLLSIEDLAQQLENSTDITVPVVDPSQRVLGIVRLSNEITLFDARFLRLRYLVIGVLAVGLFFGAASGWLSALRLERPIQQSALAVARLGTKHPLGLLPEQGPTELRLLAQAINTLVKRLQISEQAQKRLLANLVHELGRPLGALRAAVQALLDGADADVEFRSELLLGINQEMSTLQRLLDDMTKFHERLLAPFVLERRPIALTSWLLEISAPWQRAAYAKGLRWQGAIHADLPTTSLDPERLGQAIGNLFSNAIKYTPPGGAITFTAGSEAGQIWINISDTGPGIAPEEQTEIFTPFYRSRTQRRFPQGMGLGLSIAQELAAAHDGRITLQSCPGAGSCFTLWLPL